MEGNSLTAYLPIVITAIVAAGFVVVALFATHVLGPKRKTEVKNDTFECGIPVHGNARIPFSIKYFLVAILFVLFDVEVIFMYPWAVKFKDLGWLGFIEMATFILFFMVGFFYILKKGALKWE
ncbi:MAG: NADH-quinone oxidoreductase subunit A [Bacteroidia bacterium]|nr:NADH-quinone oxidoreductase subunit A [Bacteroidia bacterium]